VKIALELGAIRSFKRLSYTPWHALAEFVDNSTHSYFSHRDELDAAYAASGTGLAVDIDYTPEDGGEIAVHDNAMGMSEDELSNALVIGQPAREPRWRSRYGFGLKTAASWFGNVWTVETKRLGEPKGVRITVDVDRVADGDPVVPVEELTGLAPSDHFTRITIRQLNRRLDSRTRIRIADFLRSMYRDDLRRGTLKLTWMNEALLWDQNPTFAVGPTGESLRRNFEFKVGEKRVSGWAGVLARGSRAAAGFSILHASRVLKGWPDAWKPQEIYGQFQGSNNLVNQRLMGEINLDDFAVSQTKDSILWFNDEEQEVEVKLKAAITDLIDVAKRLRRPKPETLAPTPTEIRRTAASIQRLLSTSNLRNDWLMHRRPPEQELRTRAAAIVSRATRRPPDFAASADGLSMAGYLGTELVADDEYLVGEDGSGVLNVVINMNHPYLEGLKRDAVRAHVEHCVFEALAQWRVNRDNKVAHGDPTVTFFKDELLRLTASDSASDS
jgi:hypothetical protein